VSIGPAFGVDLISRDVDSDAIEISRHPRSPVGIAAPG
jgi:hypothetical protein